MIIKMQNRIRPNTKFHPKVALRNSLDIFFFWISKVLIPDSCSILAIPTKTLVMAIKAKSCVLKNWVNKMNFTKFNPAPKIFARKVQRSPCVNISLIKMNFWVIKIHTYPLQRVKNYLYIYSPSGWMLYVVQRTGR